ncbi:MAG TPA: hypothetical protein VGS41_18425 [Chthonomonadales bacterium]|nr:hypothetical protein [Chthonomonadales bacterium]
MRTKRDMAAIAILIVFVIAVAVWLKLTPARSTAGKAALLSVSDAVHKQEVERREMSRLQTEIGEMNPKVAAMSDQDDPESLTPRAVSKLEEVARRAGVHLEEIRPGKPQLLPSGAGERISLDIKFEARFQPECIAFLYYVEEPAGRMVVDRLSLTSADARQKTVQVAARISTFTRSKSGSADQRGGQNGASTQGGV